VRTNPAGITNSPAYFIIVPFRNSDFKESPAPSRSQMEQARIAGCFETEKSERKSFIEF
jgi:hypothetical protein